MGNASTEMRGEVRHVRGDEVRYFQEWTTLVAYLAEKMQELERQTEGANRLVDPRTRRS
jgi:hypothetical protein